MEDFIAWLSFIGVFNMLRYMLRFLFDLTIVLAVATLTMRFCIIVGATEKLALTYGLLSAVLINVYNKYRYKLL